MTQSVLEPPHCLVQTEAHLSQIQVLSWKGGQSTSIACIIALQLLMAMLSIDCHRESAIFCLNIFQPSQKHGKRFNICVMAKPQAQMQFLLMSVKLNDYQWQRKTDKVVSLHVEEGGYPTSIIQEQNVDSYMTFVILTNPFDTVSRYGLCGKFMMARRRVQTD